MVKEIQGEIDLGAGTRSPENLLTLNQELTDLRKQVREQAKEIKELQEMNEFLEEAKAFSPPTKGKYHSFVRIWK